MLRPVLLWKAAQILIDMNKGKTKVRSLRVVQDEEMELNDCRLSGKGNYTCRKHIELLAEYLTAKRRALNPNAHIIGPRDTLDQTRRSNHPDWCRPF